MSEDIGGVDKTSIIFNKCGGVVSRNLGEYMASIIEFNSLATPSSLFFVTFKVDAGVVSLSFVEFPGSLKSYEDKKDKPSYTG